MKHEYGTTRYRSRANGGWSTRGTAVALACLVAILAASVGGWMTATPAAAWGIRHSTLGSSPSLTRAVGQPAQRYAGVRSAVQPDVPMAQLSSPEITATAAFAVDLTSQRLLYEHNADERLAPASTLKIVTALTVLRVLDPDEQISVEPGDLVDTSIYSNAALQAGDKVSVRDLLAGLLIPSGGDAANALARVAGERLRPTEGQSAVDRFVDEMNQVADRLEMHNSRFANPDGRDHENQYTSARDLAFAARELLSRPVLAEIVDQPVYQMTVAGPNARSYEIYNTNELLGAEDVHGVKTGTTGDAGESVVLATRRNGNRILTVVMGSEQRYVDTQAMLDSIDNVVTWVRFDATSRFPEVASAAERQEFVLATPVVIPIRNERLESLQARVDLDPQPDESRALTWGHVVFLQDGETIYRIPVMSADN